MAEQKKKPRKNVTKAMASIKATFNNTIITITDRNGATICWESAGSVGNRGSRKGTPFAAQRAAESCAQKAKKHGVNIRRWPDSTLAKFEAAWNDVLKEESAKDPLFKKVADHFYAFRKDYSRWGNAQALKATYLK